MNLGSVAALRSKKVLLACAVGLGCVLLGPAALAKVFYAKDEALKLAFPEADRIEMLTFILTEVQLKKAEQMARVRIESKLFTFYIGKKNSEILGYAAIDSHIVRTLPETFMVVLTPEGRVRTTLVLAFYEPLEYAPAERWLGQFRDQKLSPDLWVGREIAGIAGSTLTAQAIIQGVRKVLALFQILIKETK
ncbi:MAG: FMN-binding protein [Haliea sp.]